MYENVHIRNTHQLLDAGEVVRHEGHREAERERLVLVH